MGKVACQVIEEMNQHFVLLIDVRNACFEIFVPREYFRQFHTHPRPRPRLI
jgi:hypothetical protein